MFKIFLCGDIVNRTSNVSFVDKKLRKVIKNSDISVCNFEAPLESSDKPLPKAGPHISQGEDAVSILKDNGFSHLSLANNHIFDYGQGGLSKTISEIENNGLQAFGAGLNFKTAYEPLVIKVGDLKIGLLAACEHEFGCLSEDNDRGGYAWLFHNLIDDHVKKLNKKCDLVIFIAHAGAENFSIPLPEWRARYKRLCDFGVDVVVGHHPHVPQGFEDYKGSMIFYSLGNFYCDSDSFINKEDDSYSILLTVNKDGTYDFELIFHKTIDNTTMIVEEKDVSFNIDSLNKLLVKNYKENIDKFCIDKFYTVYLPYYKSTMVANDTILGLFKKMIKLIIRRDGNNKAKRMLLLLHNIRIESHRFITQRALSSLYETQ